VLFSHAAFGKNKEAKNNNIGLSGWIYDCNYKNFMEYTDVCKTYEKKLELDNMRYSHNENNPESYNRCFFVSLQNDSHKNIKLDENEDYFTLSDKENEIANLKNLSMSSLGIRLLDDDTADTEEIANYLDFTKILKPNEANSGCVCFTTYKNHPIINEASLFSYEIKYFSKQKSKTITLTSMGKESKTTENNFREISNNFANSENKIEIEKKYIYIAAQLIFRCTSNIKYIYDNDTDIYMPPDDKCTEKLIRLLYYDTSSRTPVDYASFTVANEYARKAVEINANNVGALYMLGLSDWFLGSYSDAKMDIKKAIAILNDTNENKTTRIIRELLQYELERMESQ